MLPKWYSYTFAYLSVREALHLTGVAAEETMKIWADLVALIGFQVVALCASCLEQIRTLLGVAYKVS